MQRTSAILCSLVLFALTTLAAEPVISPPRFLGTFPRPQLPYMFRPTKVHSVNGSVENADALVQSSGPSARADVTDFATLFPGSSVVLDFGLDVGGYPVFDMSPGSEGDNASIRYTVSESLQMLIPGVGDGVAAGYANARYRYENISVTGGGERWLGRGIQGGQRFLLVEHVSGAASVVIRDVGFEAVTDTTPLENLPGSFNSSDEALNRIWAAGARTVQLGCTSKGSLNPAWQISGIGALIESKAVATFQYGMILPGEVIINLSLYIISGSTFTFYKGYQRYLDTSSSSFDLRLGALFGLTAGPNGTSTLSRSGGDSVQLPSGSFGTGSWYDIKLTVQGYPNATLSLEIGGERVGSVSYGGAPSNGTFGFTAPDNTAVILKNLHVQALDGKTLYSNSLTSSSALGDFATGTNLYPICFDGAKRDRVVWAGDISIFAATIYYSTANIEALAGSMLLATGIQDSKGQLSSSTSPSSIPTGIPTAGSIGDLFYALTYDLSAVNAWYEWYHYTGDIEFIADWWPAIKGGIAYATSFRNDSTSLIELVGDTLLSSLNYDYYDGVSPGVSTTTNSLLVWTLRNMAEISDALGEPGIASNYRKMATETQDAINQKLYSETLGAYVLTDQNSVGFSQDGNAYAVLAGVAGAGGSPTSPQSLLHSMKSLNTAYGPLSYSNTTNKVPVVSPYASGFHTWAAFEAGMVADALELMRVVWKNQVDPNHPFYTGMTWEFIGQLYINNKSPSAWGSNFILYPQNGNPFQPTMSSQAHGWGSGPTGQLSRYVLGVSPASPGYSTWSFAPRVANLTFANGRVPTPWGTIEAGWEFTGSNFKMQISGPAGANGTIVVPSAANRTLLINGLSLGVGKNVSLPHGVTWLGAEGDNLRLNVTSGRNVVLID